MQALLTRRNFALSSLAVAADLSPREIPRTVQIGNSLVRLVTIGAKKGLVYFHPHEDEYSSAIVTRGLIHERGGTLLQLRCHGAGLISFKLAGVLYTFDPERIFTDLGIVKSLVHYSRDSQAAVEVVKPLRSAILATLRRSGQPIVLVSNNSPEGVNITSYRNDGPLAAEARQVTVNPSQHPHDFFLVAEEDLFSRLSHRGFNVVQESETVPDNGSLALYCRQNGLRYVNVEAGEGHIVEQRKMLEALQPLLK